MIQINFNGFVPQYNAVETIGNLGDNKSETIHFVFNKVIDGIDISKLSCRCSYLNAEETGDVLILEPQVEGNKVTYVWVVEKNATAVKGKLQWQLSFLDAETGYTKNTNVCKFKIGDAINVEEVIDVTPTLFQQLVEQCTAQADRAREAADAIEEDVTTIKNTLTEVDERVTEAEDLLEQSKTNAEEIQGIRDEIDATKSAFDLQYEDVQQMATEVEEAKTEATTQADNAKTSAEEAAASAKRAAETAAGLESFVISKVDALPETGEERTMYLVPCAEPEGNNYFEEYLWFEDTGFEYVGSTKIDLSGYALKTDKLASPEALTIINKNSSISYDGSESKTLDLSDVSGDQVYVGDTEPTSDNVLLWIDTNEDDDEPIYGVYADDSDKLGGVEASEYATKSYVDSATLTGGDSTTFIGTTAELEALSEEAQLHIETFICTEDDFLPTETFVSKAELLDGSLQVKDSAMLGGKSADEYQIYKLETFNIATQEELDAVLDPLAFSYAPRMYQFRISISATGLTLSSGVWFITKYVFNSSRQVMQAVTYQGYGSEPIVLERAYSGTTWSDWKRTSYVENTSNPNLLINGGMDINQRSTEAYTVTTNWTYICDGWKTGSYGTNGTTTWNTDGSMTINATNGYINVLQFLEKCNQFLGKAITFSVEVDGVKHSVTTIFNSITEKNVQTYINGNSANGYISLHMGSTALTVDLVVLQGHTYTFDNAKLELGTVATPFTPRPYGEELALCQRYLWLGTEKGTMSSHIIFFGTDKINFFVPLPVSMRIASGSIIGTLNSASGVYVGKMTGAVVDGFTIVFIARENGIEVICQKTAHGLSKDDVKLVISKGCGFSTEL